MKNSILNLTKTVICLLVFNAKLFAQDSTNNQEDSVVYVPANINSFGPKAIDLTKPVGITPGAPGNTASGGATYTIPIAIPKGTNGMEPNISLVYNSQAGNGVAGFGWSISGLSVISRAGKDIYHDGIAKPISYTTNDAFVLDGMRLTPTSGSNGANGTVYATEVESFSNIVSNTTTSANNPDWFKVTGKDGTVMEFGCTTDSRIKTDDGVNVMLWRLNRIIDINGNYIDFVYDNASRDSRILYIKYTGNTNTGVLPYNQITFSYKTRQDKNTVYDGGGSLTSTYLLDQVKVWADVDYNFRLYKLNYSFDNTYSFLAEVIEQGDGLSQLNSTVFSYGNIPQNINLVQSVGAFQYSDLYSGDFDGDGKSDILSAPVYYDNVAQTQYNSSYQLNTDLQYNSNILMYNYTLPSKSKVISSASHSYLSSSGSRAFFANDFNSDGKDDVMFLTTD